MYFYEKIVFKSHKMKIGTTTIKQQQQQQQQQFILAPYHRSSHL